MVCHFLPLSTTSPHSIHDILDQCKPKFVVLHVFSCFILKKIGMNLLIVLLSFLLVLLRIDDK